MSYVDDFFSGAETIAQIIAIREALIKILSLAKMTLGKWSANDADILDGLYNTESADKEVALQEVTSTLGLKWSHSRDSFSFQLKSTDGLSLNSDVSGTVVTKRIVLSEKSKLFDPLGWVSPVLVPFNTFCQDLWIDGLDWDTPLSTEHRLVWETLKSNLQGLEEIEIPRWMKSTSEVPWSLHGFADASKRAYSACIYFIPTAGGPTLMCSKIRVTRSSIVRATHRIRVK